MQDFVDDFADLVDVLTQDGLDWGLFDESTPIEEVPEQVVSSSNEVTKTKGKEVIQYNKHGVRMCHGPLPPTKVPPSSSKNINVAVKRSGGKKYWTRSSYGFKSVFFFFFGEQR